MNMTVRQQFQKALLLLDNERVDCGEITLKRVVFDAECEGDHVTLVQGLVCLGDLLHECGRPLEARPYLERALAEYRDDDLLAYEFMRARELLGRLV